MRKHQESSPWNLEPTRWICLGLPYMEPDSKLWLVYLASKVWKQCYWGTTFVESSKKTGLQVQYFLIHAIDVTSVKVTRWSSVKSYSTGNVTNFSYECLTLVILILLLPAEVESNCIRTAKWVKWLQLHSVLSLLIPFTWHPLPDHPIGLKKKKEKKYISLYFWKSFLPNSNCFILKGFIHYLHKP